ncbi:MAG: hypothetical protein HYV07_29960 [Deltaproteobacteria bacterium]|nr:hypothetical protein [Deltaproteobacteria bacterium]
MSADLASIATLDLETRKRELEYMAQMLAVEGLTPSELERSEYLKISVELERRSKPNEARKKRPSAAH